MRRILLSVLILSLAGIFAPACCATRAPLTVEAYTAEFDPELMQELIQGLAERCPLNAPAAVQVYAIEESLWGRTSWAQPLGLPFGYYLVEIEARQSMPGIIDTLIHEWAHAMVWDASADPSYGAHGPLWGVAYADAYRAVLELLEARQARVYGLEPLPPAGAECPEAARCGTR